MFRTCSLTLTSRPNNHVILDPITNSPLLNRLGLKDNDLTKLGQHLTMEQWVKARQSQQQRRTKAPKIDGQKYQYGEKDMEIIPGLLAKVHNWVGSIKCDASQAVLMIILQSLYLRIECLSPDVDPYDCIGSNA
jgi:hypothetical protein